MSVEKIERNIAVIFATAVVGYSKHMETDEVETIPNIRVCEKILTSYFITTVQAFLTKVVTPS